MKKHYQGILFEHLVFEQNNVLTASGDGNNLFGSDETDKKGIGSIGEL